MSTSQRGALEILFPGVSASEFRTKYWPRKPLVGRGPVSRFHDVLDVPQLLDLEGLLAAYRDPVPCWGSHGNVVEVDSSKAYALYQQGFTLYIVAADKWVKALRPFVQQMEMQLGLHPGAGSVNVFATRKGFGARPHYDVTYGFSVQLKGRKTWRVMDNVSVVDPTQTHGIGSEIDPELLLYADRPMPEAWPEESEIVEMNEGDVLFTPSGRWHTTVCQDDSIAIDFNLAMRPWVEFLLPAIRERLVRSPQFRERTMSVLGSAEDQAATQRRLQEILRDLPGLLKDLSADEVLDHVFKLDRVERPTSSYERIPGSRMELGTAEGGNVNVAVTDAAGQKVEAEVEAPFRGFFEWVRDQKAPFTGVQAIAAARPLVPPNDALRALHLLEELNAVRPSGGSPRK